MISSHGRLHSLTLSRALRASLVRLQALAGTNPPDNDGLSKSCTSGVTNMGQLLRCTNTNCGNSPGTFFNPDVRSWDTSSVTNMREMVRVVHSVSARSLRTGARPDSHSASRFARQFYFNVGFTHVLSSWDASSVSDCQDFGEAASAWIAAYSKGVPTPPLSPSLKAAGCYLCSGGGRWVLISTAWSSNALTLTPSLALCALLVRQVLQL